MPARRSRSSSPGSGLRQRCVDRLHCRHGGHLHGDDHRIPAPSLGETGTLRPASASPTTATARPRSRELPRRDRRSYTLDLAAVNGTGTTSQSFTLSVDQAPASRVLARPPSRWNCRELRGDSTGSPAPAVTESGALPSAWSLPPGPAARRRLPAPDSRGDVPHHPHGHQRVTPNAVQSFTLTVNQRQPSRVPDQRHSPSEHPARSRDHDGSPTATLSATSSPALPSGVTFTANSTGRPPWQECRQRAVRASTR